MYREKYTQIGTHVARCGPVIPARGGEMIRGRGVSGLLGGERQERKRGIGARGWPEASARLSPRVAYDLMSRHIKRAQKHKIKTVHLRAVYSEGKENICIKIINMCT